MPKYRGMDIGTTGAQTPHDGVEAAMRLLFINTKESGIAIDGGGGLRKKSGRFYAMGKDDDGERVLMNSDIDRMPNK